MSGEIDPVHASKGIRAGQKVLIRRNDGRQHFAIISNVNQTTRFVAVEWFEVDETKGKEIDFATLLSLNPHLECDDEANDVQMKKDSCEEVERSSEDVEVGQDEVEVEIPKNSKPSIVNWIRPQSTFPSRSRSALDKTSKDVLKEKTTFSPDQKLDRNEIGSRSRRNLSKTRSSLSLNDFPITGKNFLDDKDAEESPDLDERGRSPSKRRSSERNSTAFNRNLETSSKVSSPVVQFNVQPRTKRKSSTVKEVERLEKNRELRRMRQAAQKEVREAMQTINSGNPNWQFQAMIHDFQGRMDFQPLTGDDEASEEHQITVCVRKRPLNKKERNVKEVDVVSIPRKNLVVVHEPKNKVDLTKYLDNQQFRFDYAFDEMCNNETVYNFTARPLVETIFDGGAATCFAYGQTGSGKTHTMSGASNGTEKGVYAMVAVDVFQKLRCPSNACKNLSVSCSYYEIYGGKVYDLLAKKARLRVLEDGKQQVQIVGLTEKMVSSVAEVLAIIQCGNNARTSGKTSANSSSSRSHAIFQISLRQDKSQKLYGRIHLIDLAGNERGADTSSASRVTRLEGAEINKSLLALKECIRALGRKCTTGGAIGSAVGSQGGHLPFRGSTLTLVLRDSFIGEKTKTCMIATISPGMASCEHSLNTLRYADRVKELAATPDVLPTSSTVHSQNENFGLEEINEDDEAASAKIAEPSKAASVSMIKSIRVLQLEQDVIDTLRIWTQHGTQLSQHESQLLADSCHGRSLDPWRFCDDLQAVLAERQKLLNSLNDRVIAYRGQLDAEQGRAPLQGNVVKDPSLKRRPFQH